MLNRAPEDPSNRITHHVRRNRPIPQTRAAVNAHAFTYIGSEIKNPLRNLPASLLAGTLILVLAFLERPLESMVAIGTLLVGIPVYWIFKSRNPKF